MRWGIALALCLSAPAAAAQPVTVAAIVDALATDDAVSAVRALSPAVSRGIAIDGPLPVDVALPEIDLTLTFERNSARLTTDAMLVLRAVARALEHPALAQHRFQVAGHTSAEGSEAHNLDLSNRRAVTVVAHLTAFYPVAQDRLIPVGYGESRLLYPESPESELNRRVTIINLAPLIN